MIDCIIFESYAEVNEYFRLEGDAALSNDRNPEDPDLIIGVYKWTWDDCGESGPDLSHIGYSIIGHVPIHAKRDVFLYERGV